MNAIYSRCSVRSYTEDTISDAQIEKLMRAAMAAPSACNQQPWEFYIVRSQKLREQLGKVTPFTSPSSKAPCCIVVCMRKNDLRAKDFAVQDAAAATQNILLEAADMGLGCCWQGIYPIRSRVNKVGEIIGISDDLEAFCLIAVGMPAEKPLAQGGARYEASRVHFIN